MSEDKDIFKNPIVIGIALLVLVAVVIAAGHDAWQERQHAKALEEVNARFASHVGKWTPRAAFDTSDEKAPATLRGKLVPIDLKTNKVDDLYFELPPSLQAGSPGEVKTVLWIKWLNLPGRRFSDGTAAYSVSCTVRILDLEEQVVLGERQFVGKEPGMGEESSGGNIYGPPPTQDIMDYLNSLPTQ